MIAERGGGYNVKGTRTGKFHNREVDGLTRKVIYLLTADPRFEGLPPGRRVAQVDSTEILPWLPGEDAELYAERFTAALEQWNQTVRGERAASQYLCIDRSFSFAPDDPVDPITAVTIVQDLIERVMEGGERLALYVVHTDKPHLHVHVIASVVDIHGKIFNRRNDDDLWAEEMSELEQQHGLRQVDHSTRRSTKPSKGTHPKSTKSAPTFRSPAKAVLRQQVQQAVLDAHSDFPQFLAALDRHDIQLVCRQRGEGSDAPITGVSFYRDGETFTGSQLAPQLAWPALRTRVGFRYEQHHESVCQRLQLYQADCALPCTMKAASEGSRRADVIELPERRPDRRKLALLASMQREAISSARSAYRWPSGADSGFQEFDPAKLVNTDVKATAGMALSLAKQQPQLSTQNGMNRKVIRCMLVRACQLGWRRVVVEGSKAFVKLAKELCQSWLKGTVQERQTTRPNPPIANAVGEASIVAPAPQLSSRKKAGQRPAKVPSEKWEVPATPREEPRWIGEVEELQSVLPDLEIFTAIAPVVAQELPVTVVPADAGDRPKHAGVEMTHAERKQPPQRRPLKVRRTSPDDSFDPMG